RLRLLVGAGLLALWAALLPQAHRRRAVHSRYGSAAAGTAGSRSTRAHTAAAGGHGELRREPFTVLDPCPVPGRAGARGLPRRGLADAPRLPVPLDQPLVCQLRGLPR